MSVKNSWVFANRAGGSKAFSPGRQAGVRCPRCPAPEGRKLTERSGLRPPGPEHVAGRNPGLTAGAKCFWASGPIVSVALLVLILAPPAFSQSIHYSLAMPQPATHVFQVEVTIDQPG